MVRMRRMLRIARTCLVLLKQPGRLILLAEAYLYLGWARILKALPFAKVAPSLGRQMAETTFQTDRATELVLHRISTALHIASKYTLWESKCLVMAIAASRMLERRKIQSTLYLGTAKDESGKMIAHAWLRSGRFYLTGANEIPKYTVVAKFGKSFDRIQHEGANSNV